MTHLRCEHPVLAMRFDVDSVTCIKRLAGLRRVADALNIRFTFMVQMGRSWSWRWRKPRDRSNRPPGGSLSPWRKLGVAGVARTLIANPPLGRYGRRAYASLLSDGHELGLHGGMSHPEWQYGTPSPERLHESFQQALDEFCSLFGHRPVGFTSPGFRSHPTTDSLLVDAGIRYRSDTLEGAPRVTDGSLWEVPVNVHCGGVPVIERALSAGRDPGAAFVQRVVGKTWAVAYDHPYVAGAHMGCLRDALRAIQSTHSVGTMADYLHRWEKQHVK